MPDTETSAPVSSFIRRGIVVTHGVGSHRRGGTLEHNVNALVSTLNEIFHMAGAGAASAGVASAGVAGASSPPDTRPRLAVSAGYTADADGIMQAAIHLYGSKGHLDEIWEVREAWWDDTFQPSSSASVIGWVLIGVLTFFVRSIKQAWLNQRREGQRPGALWDSPPSGFWTSQLTKFNSFIITTCYFLVYIAVMVIAVPLAIVLQIPGVNQLPYVGTLFNSLLGILTTGIGDQHAMTTRPGARAVAAAAVTAALRPFLSPPSAQVEYRTVTLIAHSGGCVVSFEALAGPMVRAWLGIDEVGTAQPKTRINWVTLGSGLNLAYQMRPRENPEAEAFFTRRIDRYVNWIDIYARHDPVTAGSAPAGLVAALLGGAPESLQDNDQRPYVSLRVVNHDWPFSDHGGYWINSAEVMARLTHIIADDRLAQVDAAGSAPAALQDGSLLPAGATAGRLSIPQVIRQGVERLASQVAIASHQRTIVVWSSISLLFILAVAWSILTLAPLVGIGLLFGVVIPALGILALVATEAFGPRLGMLGRRRSTHPKREALVACLIALVGIVLLVAGWTTYVAPNPWERSLVARVAAQFGLTAVTGQPGLDSVTGPLQWVLALRASWLGMIVGAIGVGFGLVVVGKLVNTAREWVNGWRPLGRLVGILALTGAGYLGLLYLVSYGIQATVSLLPLAAVLDRLRPLSAPSSLGEVFNDLWGGLGVTIGVAVALGLTLLLGKLIVGNSHATAPSGTRRQDVQSQSPEQAAR